MADASRIIYRIIDKKINGIQNEVTKRAYRASNELRNSLLYVMRGEREHDNNHRQYKIPHTGRIYTASAPGEPPAIRTGAFRLSWGSRVRVEKNGTVLNASAQIESNLKVGKYLLGELLEKGTSRMAARPYKQRVIDEAEPKIKAIYRRPYKV